MSARLWKIEPLGKPSIAHAADAVEIVGGEAVRRVTLPQLDYELYLAVQLNLKHERPVLAEALAAELDTPAEEIAAALRRLVATGLVAAADKNSLQ
jgi:hypothetical protein